MGDTTELLLVKRVRDLLECMGSLAVLVLGGGGVLTRLDCGIAHRADPNQNMIE